MLAKIEFFEVYRVLWVLEFVDTDLEDHHLQIKYFTSIECALSSLWPVVMCAYKFSHAPWLWAPPSVKHGRELVLGCSTTD